MPRPQTSNDILYSWLARKTRSVMTQHGQAKTLRALICKNREHRDDVHFNSIVRCNSEIDCSGILFNFTLDEFQCP